PPPRLDAVPHLGEPEAREPRRDVTHEPLERRAPGPLHLAGLAAVHADDHRFALAGESHLGTRREADDLARSLRHPDVSERRAARPSSAASPMRSNVAARIGSATR